MSSINQTLSKKIYLILFFYLIAAGFTLVYFDGTGDGADSITHFLFAKYAPVHPELYFDHWAKPLFVLLASPFAQFGFIGIKIFNVLVVGITLLLTYRVALLLDLKYALFAPLILIFSPLYFQLTFSGLTEPLFALFLIWAVHSVLKHKLVFAALIISFLPFIRTEGLFFIGVFGLYFLLKRKGRILPWLAFGHVLYSLAGLLVYDDFLWVFTKIPYASLDSPYGSGELFHFVDQLLYLFGIPNYILLWLGFILSTLQIVKKKRSIEFSVLVYLGFVVFFIAHSLFWYLGIFNSMGLRRVFIGVIPLMALIALNAVDLLGGWLQNKKSFVRNASITLIVLSIGFFPFTDNHAALHWEKDMRLWPAQKIAKELANRIHRDYGNKHRFVYANNYLSLALELDHFDNTHHVELTNAVLPRLKVGDIVIWDNWSAGTERKVDKAYLEENLSKLFEIRSSEPNENSTYAVYKKM